MQRITVDGVDYVPVKALVGLAVRVAFYVALGFGMGAVALVPWLAKTSVWQSERAEKLAESMMDQAAKCEGRMMVMERACPLAFRAQRAAMKNVGGE